MSIGLWLISQSLVREDCETLSFFNKRSETFLRDNEDKEFNYETKILSRIYSSKNLKYSNNAIQSTSGRRGLHKQGQQMR
jgi:hypothetical protein